VETGQQSALILTMSSKFTDRVRINTASALTLLALGAVCLWNWSVMKAGRIDDFDLQVPLWLRVLPWISIIASGAAVLIAGFVMTPRRTLVKRIVYWVTSWVVVFLSGFLLASPIYTSSYSGPPYGCRGHLQSLGFALRFYATDFDDRLPSQGWMDEVHGYDWARRCTLVEAPGYGYALSREVAGAKWSTVPDDKVLLYDSTLLERSALGNIREDFAPRHHDGEFGYVLYANHSGFPKWKRVRAGLQ
jgi:hypothetical protein